MPQTAAPTGILSTSFIALGIPDVDVAVGHVLHVHLAVRPDDDVAELLADVHRRALLAGGEVVVHDLAVEQADHQRLADQGAAVGAAARLRLLEVHAGDLAFHLRAGLGDHDPVLVDVRRLPHRRQVDDREVAAVAGDVGRPLELRAFLGAGRSGRRSERTPAAASSVPVKSPSSSFQVPSRQLHVLQAPWDARRCSAYSTSQPRRPPPPPGSSRLRLNTKPCAGHLAVPSSPIAWSTSTLIRIHHPIYISISIIHVKYEFISLLVLAKMKIMTERCFVNLCTTLVKRLTFVFPGLIMA